MRHSRAWIVAAGTLFLIGGAFASFFGCNAAPLLVLGVLILAGSLFDRIYGAANGTPSGADWTQTGERFIDPDSGEPAEVWYNAKTGERRYVVIGTDDRDTPR